MRIFHGFGGGPSQAALQRQKEEAAAQAERERVAAEREAQRKARSAMHQQVTGGRRSTLLATAGSASGPVSNLNVRKQVLGVS